MIIRPGCGGGQPHADAGETVTQISRILEVTTETGNGQRVRDRKRRFYL
jgi:hypothetical protein